MLMILFSICVILVLSIVILGMSFLMGLKVMYDREKLSSYECGFMPFSKRRYPFSLHFFLIGVIFLIFDVEVVLLLPMVLVTWYTNMYIYMFILLIFLGVLLFGLFYEWVEGSLSWSVS